MKVTMKPIVQHGHLEADAAPVHGEQPVEDLRPGIEMIVGRDAEERIARPDPMVKKWCSHTTYDKDGDHQRGVPMET
jgi:hypothetical protein